MKTEFPIEANAQFSLSGPIGNIQLATTSPKEKANNKVILICHPHPLYGGTMDNKVITTLMRSFNQLGFKTVRFNFRGVGETEGKHDNGLGEADDVLAIIEWLQQSLPTHDIWLAGFSFGAYAAYRVAGCEQMKGLIKQLILVAPPVFYPEFAQLPQPNMPTLVLQGEDDEVVDAGLVFNWVTSQPQAMQLERFPKTSHFFHGKLVDLKNSLVQTFT